MHENLMEIVTRKINNKEEVALVIITKAEGSSPRGVGSMMAVDKNGELISGTIGGGAVEVKASRDAAECIKNGASRSVSYVLNPAGGENNLPMACGGNIEVFIQVFRSPDKLLIVGAGHVGLSLYKMAKILGYYVTILDDRQELLNKERFPEADQLIHGDIADELKRQYIDESTSIVIITHGHIYDQAALEAVINSPARYIGMIGSRNKIATVYENLEKKGITRENLRKVHAPVGLDIGGEGRTEVALAIIAEIQAVKYGRSGGFLSGK
jgi:xanthine dehydrogenase accessory factor